MTNLAEEILNKIEKEEIKPIPKWRFLINGYLLWSLFVLNLVIGSISIAISIYLITNSETLSDISLSQNPVEWLVYSIPIFWIVFTAIFIFISYYNYKHTEKGYRLGLFKFICLNICITLLLGFALNFTGVASGLNNYFSQNIPLYNQVVDLRSEVWMRPDEGYLAGKILSINESEKTFELQDLNNKTWTIDYSNSFIKPSVDFSKDTQIKILGKKTSDNKFESSEIRPWNGKNQNMQENHRNSRSN